jgi:hypothetical protein
VVGELLAEICRVNPNEMRKLARIEMNFVEITFATGSDNGLT